ncbi:MAG: SDR family oxidoreductase [Desulfobulbaceae bacterium]|nr:SDR family oxidoreductase [Desulfobulbaceae bacterium]
MKKFLVTGGSGLLGANCLQMLKENNKVVGLYNAHQVSMAGVDWMQLDLTDKMATGAIIAYVRPDVIIHCAALTDVDFCERHPKKARQLNVEVSSMLAGLAKKYDSHLVHISSDAVYGSGRGHAVEDDEPVAVNEYAHTKILAEKAVAKANGEAIIIRTPIYGWNIQAKCSFAEAILRTLVNNRQATLFQDVFFSPMLVNHLIEIIMELLAKGARGIYNVGSPEGISKLDFGNNLADICGLATGNIVPIIMSEKKLTATRPLNPTMNVEKVSKFLGWPMPAVRQGLAAFMDLLTNGYVEQLKPGMQTLQQLKKAWQ